MVLKCNWCITSHKAAWFLEEQKIPGQHCELYAKVRAKDHHLSAGSLCLTAFGQRKRHMSQFVSCLSVHLADFAPRWKILGSVGVKLVCLVFPCITSSITSPREGWGESCYSCPFTGPTLSIPKGHSLLPESVKVVSLLLCRFIFIPL